MERRDSFCYDSFCYKLPIRQRSSADLVGDLDGQILEESGGEKLGITPLMLYKAS